MNPVTIIITGLGGFIGTILRYLTSVLFRAHSPSSLIPYGTLVINIAGCLGMGIIYGLSERYQLFPPPWKAFLLYGICGGFATFSAFAYENIILLQQQDYMRFVLYSMGTLLLCLLSVFASLTIIKYT
jgi:CrcB protein